MRTTVGTNSMRQSLVIANWKLHGDLNLVNQMVASFSQDASADYATDVVICPPAPYLTALYQKSLDCAPDSVKIKVGAQNCSEFEKGAYTGEIAARMLQETGCEYVILGHSERRTVFAESDSLIAQKLKAAQSAGLIAVLCVGESLAERESEQTIAVVTGQLSAALKDVDFSRLVIAYEPVWAIGTGKTASPEQAQAVHKEIRHFLTQMSAEEGSKVPLLYGGSVKAENAEVLFAQTDIDGGLIGGASLEADQFRAICRAVKG